MEGSIAGAAEVTKTPRLQHILDAAAEIAALEGHSHVGVEHVVRAILKDPRAIPTQVMKRLDLDVERIETEIAAAMHTDGYKALSRNAQLLDGTRVQY